MILVGNHVNFLMRPWPPRLYPRKMFPGQKETFDQPILDFLFRIWGSIPVNRGTADFSAWGKAVKVLERGISLHFPGGNPNKRRLPDQRSFGVVLVALKTGVPILPIALYGSEQFTKRMRKLRRTRITFRVGEPFLLRPGSPHPKKEERQIITDEIMYQLARLLPEEYRGYYADLSKASTQHLAFIAANEKFTEAVLSTGL